MGEAALAALGKRVADGVIAVPRGAEGQSGPVRFAAAGHPVPDIFSLAAAREILSLLESAGKGDLVVALVSGGGSAMLSAPVAGITMEEKAETFRILLRAGADIASFNAVRKHLSEVKGGLLTRAAQPATVWALLLSDVPGDDPSVIASGPFSPDPTTFSDAIGVLERYGIYYAVPSAVRRTPCRRRGRHPPRNPETGRLRFPRDNLRSPRNEPDGDGRGGDADSAGSGRGPHRDRPPARLPSRRGEGVRPFFLCPAAEGRGSAFPGACGCNDRRRRDDGECTWERKGWTEPGVRPRRGGGTGRRGCDVRPGRGNGRDRRAHRRRGGVRRTEPPSRAPRPLGSTPPRTCPATMPTRSSRRWETWSSPDPPAPTWPIWRSDGRGNLLV